MVEFVFQCIDAFSFGRGESEFLHDGILILEFFHGEDEFAVFDDDGNGAVIGVVRNGDVEIAVRNARQFDVEIGEEIAFMPHGVGLAGDPLAFRGGPMAHEAVRLEDGILLFKFFDLNAFRVQFEIGENSGRVLRRPDGVGTDEIVAALPDEDEFAVFQRAKLAFFRSVQHEFKGSRLLFSVRQNVFECFDDFVLLAGRGGIEGICFGGVVRLAGDGEASGSCGMGGPFRGEAERPTVALRLDGRFENAINGLRASKSEQRFVRHRNLRLLGVVQSMRDIAFRMEHVELDAFGGFELDVRKMLDGYVVHTRFFRRVEEHAEFTANRQWFGDAEKFVMIEIANDFVTVGGDAGQIPLVRIKRNFRTGEKAFDAVFLMPEADFMLSVRRDVHAHGEGVEFGLGGIGLRRFFAFFWRRENFVAMVENNTAFAFLQLDGAGDGVVVVEIVASGDNVVNIGTAAFEGVEVRRLVGGQRGAFRAGLIRFRTDKCLLQSCMETPCSCVDVPRIEFIGSAFLNHEICEEGDFRNGQEFGRALQTGGLFVQHADGSGHREHRRHDGAERAVHEERPFVIADFDRVFDVGLRRGGRGIRPRDLQIRRLVIRK